MKVSAVCFGQMREFLPPDAEGNRATLELDDTARVLDLVHMVGAPERLIYVLLVNGERGRLEDPLADGDEVTLMPPYSGGSEDVVRCGWALPSELMSEYHDTEWGVPLRDDRGQFEFLVLEGVQAGLSWSTVLNKRGNYRDALDGFDPEKIARYDETKVEMLLINAGLIRNRAKMNAAVSNAKAFLEVRDSMGSFSDYIWQFVDGKPVVNGYKSMNAQTGEVLGEISPSKPEEIRGVVEAARKVQPEWAAIAPPGRARHLREVRHRIYRHLDDIVETISQECGKPHSEALAHDVMPAVVGLQYMERMAPKWLRHDHPGWLVGPVMGLTSRVEYRPFGVVGCIAPWNYPFFLSLMGVVPALLAGNTVCLLYTSPSPRD